jgi:hypothetical protein
MKLKFIIQQVHNAVFAITVIPPFMSAILRQHIEAILKDITAIWLFIWEMIKWWEWLYVVRLVAFINSAVWSQNEY